MTLLVSWTGVDTHGTASVYIAADSRVSWGGGDIAKFDHGRKVFAFRNSPDILGYCGDVLFPSIVLSQITEMADRGLLFSVKASCKERFEAIKEKLVQQFRNYPSMEKSITDSTLQVLHISRDPINSKNFACWLIEWKRNKGWADRSISLPSNSGVLFSLGSGAKEFEDNFERYKDGPDKGTSRSVFHCFCYTLSKIKDRQCGGSPQLVGIYRKPDSPAIAYGIIRDKKRYFLGAPIYNNKIDLVGVEWRNDLFERCDGKTMRRLEKAQAQPDHMRIK